MLKNGKNNTHIEKDEAEILNNVFKEYNQGRILFCFHGCYLLQQQMTRNLLLKNRDICWK